MRYLTLDRSFWTVFSPKGIQMQDSYWGKVKGHGTNVWVKAKFMVVTEPLKDEETPHLIGYITKHPDTKKWRAYSVQGKRIGREQELDAFAITDVVRDFLGVHNSDWSQK